MVVFREEVVQARGFRCWGSCCVGAVCLRFVDGDAVLEYVSVAAAGAGICSGSSRVAGFSGAGAYRGGG